jgi:hypothetical protein
LQSGSEWWESDKAMASQIHFVQTFGLGWTSWDSNSEHTWFMPDYNMHLFNIQRPSDAIFDTWFSRHIFTNGLTLLKLKEARSYYWQSINDSIPLVERQKYSLKSSVILETFISKQKENHPFMYYVGYRLKLLSRYLNHRLGAGVYSYKYPFNVVITFFDAIANSFIFIVGSISLIVLLLFKKHKSTGEISIYVIPLFVIGYFCFYLRIDESRFVTLAFPYFLLASVQSLSIIKTSKYKYIALSTTGLFLLSSGIYSVVNDIKW